MKSKRCYYCKCNYPLFMFHKAKRFTIATDLGRNRCCRICVFRTAKHPVVRWDASIKKFNIVKLTLKERIKEFFKF
jgi:hypothetical protein